MYIAYNLFNNNNNKVFTEQSFVEELGPRLEKKFSAFVEACFGSTFARAHYSILSWPDAPSPYPHFNIILSFTFRPSK
jgi:ABC-type uncharacterized transport system auxiliary subunit